MTEQITIQDSTENTIKRVSVLLASCIFPAPSRFPTMMPMALPTAITATLNRFITVEEML